MLSAPGDLAAHLQIAVHESQNGPVLAGPFFFGSKTVVSVTAEQPEEAGAAAMVAGASA
jgi:hypothetical protein